MPYSPLNIAVFTASYAGAMAGMGVADRVLTSTNPADYANIPAATALAWAESFDTAYGAVPADSYVETLIEEASQTTWQGRSIPSDPSFQVAATYTPQILALLAVITAGSTALTAAGIIPPTPVVDGGTVANIAALTASSDATDATIRLVLTVLQPFQLDQSSTATVDGISVVATASGVGRWLRIVSIVPRWTNQLSWFVDSVAGNDENSGLTGFPLKTAREMSRRIRLVTPGNTYTLNVSAAGLPSTDVPRFAPGVSAEVTGNVTFLISGTAATSNTVTSTLTAAAPTNAAGNVQASITDATVTWAAQVGQTITMTSGAANGAVATVLADLGAGSARVSNFVFPFNGVTAAFPSAADTYVIKLYPLMLTASGSQGLPPRVQYTYQNLDVAPPNGIGIMGTYTFSGGRLRTSISPQTAGLMNAINLFGVSVIFGSITTFADTSVPSQTVISGGGFINCRFRSSVHGLIAFDNCVLQGCTVLTTGKMAILSRVGIFDTPAGNPGMLASTPNGLPNVRSSDAQGIYGTSATSTFGVAIRDGARMLLPNTCTPSINTTSGGAQLDLDGGTAFYQQLELQSGVLGAAVVVPMTTFAQWAAAVVLNVSGFNRNIISYKTLAGIITAPAL